MSRDGSVPAPRAWWVAIARILLGLPLSVPVERRTPPAELQDTRPAVSAPLSPVHPRAQYAGGAPAWMAAWDRWAGTVHGPKTATLKEAA